jgi:hypothetical protein
MSEMNERSHCSFKAPSWASAVRAGSGEIWTGRIGSVDVKASAAKPSQGFVDSMLGETTSFSGKFVAQ